MILYCPRCGANLPVQVENQFASTAVRCPDCRLAPTEPPDMLAPNENESQEIGYDLSDWAVADRGPVTAALVEMGIPYRWEDELLLVIDVRSEEQVDRLMDELEAELAEDDGDGAVRPGSIDSDDDGGADDGGADDGGADTDGDGNHGDGIRSRDTDEDHQGEDEDDEDDEDDDEDDDDEDDEEEDGGEEAMAAMSDLFIAADRLKDAPADIIIAGEFADVAQVVADCLPPYGIERGLWSSVQARAAAIVDLAFPEEPEDGAQPAPVLGEDGEPIGPGEAALLTEEKIAEESRQLRDVLRAYI